MTAVTIRPDSMAYASWWTSGRRSSVPAAAVATGTVPGTSLDTWAEDLWNAHGQRVYALACAVMGDGPAAMQAVALGMVDLLRSDVTAPGEDTARSLALHVYRRSSQAAGETLHIEGLPPAMVRLAQLARLQRASLALCAFGGFTYTEAAEVLEVPAPAVAQLLTSGLDELGRSARPAITA